jgi:hypothetical protein
MKASRSGSWSPLSALAGRTGLADATPEGEEARDLASQRR